jgi:hypothetical protein
MPSPALSRPLGRSLGRTRVRKMQVRSSHYHEAVVLEAGCSHPVAGGNLSAHPRWLGMAAGAANAGDAGSGVLGDVLRVCRWDCPPTFPLMNRVGSSVPGFSLSSPAHRVVPITCQRSTGFLPGGFGETRLCHYPSGSHREQGTVTGSRVCGWTDAPLAEIPLSEQSCLSTRTKDGPGRILHSVRLGGM